MYIFNLLSVKKKRGLFWWVGLELGIVAVLIYWWWNQDDLDDEEYESDDRIVLEPESLDNALGTRSTDAVVPTDDLTDINGIGTIYAQTLVDAGVTTFKKLAELDPEGIREIFQAAGGRVPNPSDWIEQAAQKGAS